MQAEEITQLIEAEIAGDWTRSNAHGVDLRKCLVEPTRQEFEDSFDPSRKITLWLVLEEDPETRGGYMIVYGEDEKMFGLAIHGIKTDTFLGWYGSFIETLECM